MATTTTYNLEKPTVGGSENTWGTDINNNLDKIDDLLDGTESVDGIDINGGSIDGTPIGAASASTGAFTTISASGDITGNVKGDIKATDGTVVLNNGTDGTDATFAGSAVTLATPRAFSVSGDVATSAGVDFDGSAAVDLGVTITDALWDKIYPNGSIYATTDDAFDPNNAFYGDWFEYAQGEVLVGYVSGDVDFGVMGGTGGEKAHQLTVAELPAHSHSYTVKTGRSYSSSTGTADNGVVQGSNGIQLDSESQTTDNTGSGTAHSNLQPYVVVKYWRRNDNP